MRRFWWYHFIHTSKGLKNGEQYARNYLNVYLICVQTEPVNRYVPFDPPVSQAWMDDMLDYLRDVKETKKIREALADEAAGYMTPRTLEYCQKIVTREQYGPRIMFLIDI